MDLIKQIENAFKIKEERNWDNIYFMFDIHGTILKPTYSTDEEPYEFYPFAKETLQLITQMKGIINILWSCTSDLNLKKYHKMFLDNGINFQYINENPEIINTELASFDKKLYCSVGFDDKFGFEPERDWFPIYEFFENKIQNELPLNSIKKKYEGKAFKCSDGYTLFTKINGMRKNDINIFDCSVIYLTHSSEEGIYMIDQRNDVIYDPQPNNNIFGDEVSVEEFKEVYNKTLQKLNTIEL